MWQVCIAVLLTSTTSALDTLELMQHGVHVTTAALEQAASQAEFHKALKGADMTVSDMIQNATADNREQIRKFKATLEAIDLKQIAAEGKMDPGTTEYTMMNVISTLFASILNEYLTEKNGDEISLNGVLSLITDCGGHWDDQEQALYIAQGQADDLHDACRVAELGLLSVDYCAQLLTAMQTNYANQPDCVPPTGSDWDAFVQNGYDWFETANTEFTNLQTLCDQQVADLNARIALCQQLQMSWEQAYCSWATFVELKCTHQLQCYTAGITEHNMRLAITMPVATARLDQVVVVLYIQCVIAAIMQDANLVSNCAPYQTSSPIVQYYMVVPPVVPTFSCTGSTVTYVPGDALWNEKIMGHFHPDLAILDPSGIDCSTTTSSHYNPPTHTFPSVPYETGSSAAAALPWWMLLR